MPEFAICRIAIPTRDEFQPSWVMEQSDAIRHRDAVDVLGDPDFFTPLAHTVHGLRRQVDSWNTSLVALEGSDWPDEVSWEQELAPRPGRVVGIAGVGGGITDNTTTAEGGVIVAHGHRRHGVGTALLAACEELARAHGCTTFQAWAEHRAIDGDEDVLMPPSGAGRVPHDEPCDFALASGFTLEQCEQHSVCPLPGDVEALNRMWDEALPHSDGYRLLTVIGAVPEDLIDSWAELLEHFSIEVPNGGLEAEAERWDAERIRRGEARRAAAGRTSIITFAIHEDSGQVVASTDITTDAVHEGVCFQQTTVVDSRHRGHRLGLLVKIANHRALSEHFPERRRVHTWNADENQWMLAINTAMGFTPQVIEGAWQKYL